MNLIWILVDEISYVSAKLSRNKARDPKTILHLHHVSLCAFRRVRNSYHSFSSFTLVREVDSFEGRCVIQMKCVCSQSSCFKSSVVGIFPGNYSRNFWKVVPFSEEIKIYIRKWSLCNFFLLILKSISCQTL